ncbi:MAG: hypothetical protein E7395_01440 [Ruminococcaceae bacterium]|nr:hypothetical protein [Oscillospiraceae bacterium]
MNTYFGIDTHKKREELLSSKLAKPFIDDIIAKADAALGKQYMCLRMSDYMLFEETGNRTIFERPYFERRNDCSYVSIAYWLTDDVKYLKPLIDLIFIISDEYSWCLPAHNHLSHKSPSVADIIRTVDLFAAETARLFADIAIILAGTLPSYVIERMEYEIRRRIIDAMKKYEFHWKREINNWAAVCGGGVGIALLRFGTQNEIDEILPQLYSSMESFIAGFGSDGCCREGYSYWNYGLGYFLLFARAILHHTGGKTNYFKRDIIKKIAMYPQRVRMSMNKTASFSDSKAELTFCPGVMSFLKSLYGDEFECPDLSLANMNGNVFAVKEFLWFDTSYKADTPKTGTAYFPEAQWYIKKGKNFSFAAKGGHNNEMHNHNDIGSFMIVTQNGHIPLADFGSAAYEKKTFDNRYRYTMLNNSSRGHSVPIINGAYQCFGAEYAASDVNWGDDFFALSITGAYEKGCIKKADRSFEITDDRVVLKDVFERCDKTESVVERMVSWTKPMIYDGCVDFGTAKVVFDANRYKASYTSEVYRAHGDREDLCAYLVDYNPIKNDETEFVFEIIVQ